MQNTSENQLGDFDYSGPKAIAAATILGTVGALTILVMPGLLGVIVDAFGLDDQQLGVVASVEIFAMAIATGVTTFGICRFNWRTMALLALLVLAAGNLATMIASTFPQLLLTRGVSGIGEGVAVALSFSALGATRNPDRSFGIYLLFALAFAAAVLYVFPDIVELGGHLLVFSFLIAICVLNMLCLPWLPPQPKGGGFHPDGRKIRIPYKLAFIGLLMVTFYFIAQGAVWSYVERMGLDRGIDRQMVGTALSLSALSGIAGAGVAMLLGNRVWRSVPITFGVLVQIISMLMLTADFDQSEFIAAVMIFNFSWNLCQPYFSGVMSELDASGRVVALMGSLQTIGVALGPFIAAMIIRPGQYTSICYLGIGTVLVALLLSYLLFGLWKHQKGRSSDFLSTNMGVV